MQLSHKILEGDSFTAPCKPPKLCFGFVRTRHVPTHVDGDSGRWWWQWRRRHDYGGDGDGHGGDGCRYLRGVGLWKEALLQIRALGGRLHLGAYQQIGLLDSGKRIMCVNRS